MNPLRRAALALNALSRRDRQWLLQQLPAAQRGRLQPLLSELSGLRITMPLNEVLDLESPRPEQAAPDAPESDAARAAAKADAPAVFAYLRDEPDWAVALVCGAARWPWQDELFGLLGSTRSARVAALMRELPRQKARPRQALIHILARSLAQDSRFEAHMETVREAPRATGRFAWAKRARLS